MNDENSQPIPIHHNRLPRPDGAPHVPMQSFEGQFQFGSGQVAQFQVQAIDHIGAMVKITALLSDHPDVLIALWLKHKPEGMIVMPSGVLPK